MYKTYNNHVVLALIAGFVDDMVWLYLPAIHQDIFICALNISSILWK